MWREGEEYEGERGGICGGNRRIMRREEEEYEEGRGGI